MYLVTDVTVLVKIAVTTCIYVQYNTYNTCLCIYAMLRETFQSISCRYNYKCKRVK